METVKTRIIISANIKNDVKIQELFEKIEKNF